MAVQQAQVTVGTTATELSATQTDHTGGESLLITAPAAVTLYLGDGNVTSTAYGYALAAGTSIGITLDAGEQLFAAVASGTATAYVLRQGV